MLFKVRSLLLVPQSLVVPQRLRLLAIVSILLVLVCVLLGSSSASQVCRWGVAAGGQASGRSLAWHSEAPLHRVASRWPAKKMLSASAPMMDDAPLLALEPLGQQEQGGAVVAVERGGAAFSPHIGWVFVDWSHNERRWIVSHTRTGERVALPHAEHTSPSIMFDQDGFGCLIFEADMEPQLIDDTLTETLCVNAEGSIILLSGQGGVAGPTASLEALQNMWRLATLVAHLGPLRNEVKLDMAMWARLRCGCRCWWSL